MGNQTSQVKADTTGDVGDATQTQTADGGKSTATRKQQASVVNETSAVSSQTSEINNETNTSVDNSQNSARAPQTGAGTQNVQAQDTNKVSQPTATPATSTQRGQSANSNAPAMQTGNASTGQPQGSDTQTQNAPVNNGARQTTQSNNVVNNNTVKSSNTTINTFNVKPNSILAVSANALAESKVSTDDTYDNNVTVNDVNARKLNNADGGTTYSYEATVHVNDTSKVGGKQIYFMFNPITDNKYVTDYLNKNLKDIIVTSSNSAIDPQKFGTLAEFNGGYYYAFDPTESVAPYSTDLHFVANWIESPDAKKLLNSTKNGGLYKVANGSSKIIGNSDNEYSLYNDINIGLGTGHDDNTNTIDNYQSLDSTSSNLFRTVTLVPQTNQVLQVQNQTGANAMVDTRQWYQDGDGNERVSRYNYDLSMLIPLSTHVGNDFDFKFSQALDPDLFDYIVGSHNVPGGSLDLTNIENQNKEIQDYLQKVLPSYAFTDSNVTAKVNNIIDADDGLGTSITYSGKNIDPSKIHVTVTDLGSTPDRIQKDISVHVDGPQVKWGSLSNQQSLLVTAPTVITGTVKKGVDVTVPNNINSSDADEKAKVTKGYYSGKEQKDPRLASFLINQNGISYLMTSPTSSGSTPGFDQKTFPDTPDLITGVGKYLNDYATSHNLVYYRPENNLVAWALDPDGVKKNATSIPTSAVEAKDSHTMYADDVKVIYVDATGQMITNAGDYSKLPVLSMDDFNDENWGSENAIQKLKDIRDRQQTKTEDDYSLSYDIGQVYGYGNDDKFIPLNWEHAKTPNGNEANSYTYTETQNGSIITRQGDVYVPLVHKTQQLDNAKSKHVAVTVHVNYPADRQKDNTVYTFTVNAKQQGVQDLVTGERTYSTWSGTFTSQSQDGSSYPNTGNSISFFDNQTEISDGENTRIIANDLDAIKNMYMPEHLTQTQNGFTLSFSGYGNDSDTQVYMNVMPETKTINDWLDKAQNTDFTINLVPRKYTSYIHFVDTNPSDAFSDTDMSKYDYHIPLTDAGAKVQLPNLKVPDGFKLADGAKLPTEYEFTTTKNGSDFQVKTDPINVNVVHDVEVQNPESTPKVEFVRHITINYPTGQPDVITQRAVFEKPTVYDKATKKTVTASDWELTSGYGTDTLNSIYGKQIDGYEAEGHADGLTVYPTTDPKTIQDVTINYKKTGQGFLVNYIDNGDKKTIIDTQGFSGNYGDDVYINYQAPDGWEIVQGQNLPTDTKITEGAMPNVSVYIQHKLDQIYDDNDTEAHKTVTRTVNIIDPDGSTDSASTVQTVNFDRPIYKDEVTGKTTYGYWNKISYHFDAINIPVKAGYTVSGDVPAIDVTPVSDSTTLTIRYNPVGQNVAVNYIDDNGNVISTHNVTGQPNQSTVIDGTQYIPEHWVLEDGQNTTINYTFKVGSNDPISFKIKHKLTAVSDDHSGNKTITRTIKITRPDGTSDPLSRTQSVTFTRDAFKDEVTNQTTYGDWHEKTQTMKGFNVPKIGRYVPSANVPDWIVTPDDQDKTIEITYDENAIDNYYKFVDLDYKDGDPVIDQEHHFSGKPGQTVQLDGIQIPAHYVLADKQELPSSYTFKDDGQNSPIIINVRHHYSIVTDGSLPLSKTITRNINITAPDGRTTNEQQSVTFTRTAERDDVDPTNVKYSDWSNNGKQTLDSIDLPIYTGYKPNDTVPSVNVTPESGSKQPDVNITYTEDLRSSYYVFVDDMNNGEQLGGQHAINGLNGQTVKLNIQAPTNYVIVGDTPTSYLLNDKDNHPLTIHLTHMIDHNPTGADNKRTITRTIVINTPNADSHNVVQTASFTRDASKDMVTGKVTYGNWNVAGNMFDAYDVPQEVGYDSYIDGQKAIRVKNQNLTPDSKNSVVQVTYKLGIMHNSWQFVDDDNNGSFVGDVHRFDGHLGETVKLSVVIPANYVASGQVPTEYRFDKNNNPILIHLKHDYEQNVPAQDLNRTVTRVVNTTMPDGTTSSQTQTATFTRTAKRDKVTGQIVYNPWNKASDTFNALPIKQVYGYVSQVDGHSYKSVSAAIVTPDTKSSTVNVTYIVQQGSQTIIYVDPTGTEVTRQVISDPVSTTDKFTPSIPDGWKTLDKIPDSVTIKDVDDPVKYRINHMHVIITPDKPIVAGSKIDGTQNKTYPQGLSKDDLNKTITQVVTITNPQSMTTNNTQSLTFTRTADLDVVTGDIKYSPWTSTDGKNSFSEVAIPQIDHYISVVNGKPAISVTSRTADPDKETGTENIAVSYKKVNETAVIDHDKPLNLGDIIPSTDIKAPNGLSENYLNKTVTREIDVVLPNGTTQKHEQQVVLYRNAAINLDTMLITYTDWTANGKDEWDEYKAPSITGYTATPSVVPEEFVTGYTKNNKVVITYSKIDNNNIGNTNNIGNFNNFGNYSGDYNYSGNSIANSITPLNGWSINNDQNVGVSENTNNDVIISDNADHGYTDDDDNYQSNSNSYTKHSSRDNYTNNYYDGDHYNSGINYTNNSHNNAGYAGQATNAVNVVSVPATITSASGIAGRVIGNVNGQVNSGVSYNGNNVSVYALPQTGSMNNIAMIALGMVAVSLSVGMAIPRKRKD